MQLRIGKTEARENWVWRGGGRRRANARQGRQRSPRPVLIAELYRFSTASTIYSFLLLRPGHGQQEILLIPENFLLVGVTLLFDGPLDDDAQHEHGAEQGEELDAQRRTRSKKLRP